MGQPAPAITSNGYSSGAEGWSPEPAAREQEQERELEQAQEQEQELRYEAESPDEAALVYAARAYNCALADRLHDQVSVELPHLGRLTFELLHTLGFDSIRKRMSVVIRHPLTDEIYVYTKGADSVIMDLLLPCSSGIQLPRLAAPPAPGRIPRNQTLPQSRPTDKVIFINSFLSSPHPRFASLHGTFRL